MNPPLNRLVATTGSCLLAAALLAACATRAPAPSLPPAELAARAATTPPFSEERNAASGFIGTQNFYIGRMALSCRDYLEEPASFPQDEVAKWQRANGRYFHAMTRYVSDLLASVPDAEAAALLRACIKDQVQTAGQAIVDHQLAGSAAENT